MKQNRLLIMLAAIAIVVFLGIYVTDRLLTSHVCPLLSPVQLQERLGVKPDGKIGPETMKAWDKHLCDQYAAEAMEPYIEDDGYLKANWD